MSATVTILLQREPTVEDMTFGKLFWDGHRTWDTLEDAIREVPGQPVESWKVPGRTAIPAGLYRVRLTPSQRFGRLMPQLLDVPGFTGVRLHAGNTVFDTAGCPLVGWSRQARAIGQSRIAFGALFESFKEAEARGDEVWIRVENPPA